MAFGYQVFCERQAGGVACLRGELPFERVAQLAYLLLSPVDLLRRRRVALHRARLDHLPRENAAMGSSSQRKGPIRGAGALHL